MAEKPNQTKMEIGILGQNILWRGVMTFMCPVSFNLIVCIGPVREELGNNRKELFSLLALIKKNTVTLL